MKSLVFLSTCEQDHFFYSPLYSTWRAAFRMCLFLLGPFLQRSPNQSPFQNLWKTIVMWCKWCWLPPQLLNEFNTKVIGYIQQQVALKSWIQKNSFSTGVLQSYYFCSLYMVKRVAYASLMFPNSAKVYNYALIWLDLDFLIMLWFDWHNCIISVVLGDPEGENYIYMRMRSYCTA